MPQKGRFDQVWLLDRLSKHKAKGLFNRRRCGVPRLPAGFFEAYLASLRGERSRGSCFCIGALSQVCLVTSDTNKHTLGLQIAQSRSCFQTLGSKLGIFHLLWGASVNRPN